MRAGRRSDTRNVPKLGKAKMSNFDFRLSADGSHIFPLAENAGFELERELHLRFPAAYQWYEISQTALVRLLGRGFTFC